MNFNAKLQKLYTPMSESARDAMWAGAIALGCIAFFCVEGDSPLDVWPLKPPGPLDLDWLKISDGKKEIFRACDPLRPESCFASLVSEQMRLLAPVISDPTLPEGFRELWGEHPYQRQAILVGQLMPLECTRKNVLSFLSFITHIEGDFAQALVQRDAKAMLLLGVWYAKMCRYRQWWTMRRVVLEGQAVVMYLQQHHQGFVQGVGKHLYGFVRSGTGLEKGWEWRDFAREAGLAHISGKEGMCWRAEYVLGQSGDFV